MPEQPDYEYKGLMATYWDLLRGDTTNWDDRFFYSDIIVQSGQPALDVGCGTGRILLDYLSQGIEIEGVDNSPEMLAICREKAAKLGFDPVLYRQEMQALDLPRKYRTIIVPSSSFQLVLDPADAAEVIRRFFDHLDPGGTLVMPFMILWTEASDHPIASADWFLLVEKADPNTGALVRRSVRHRYDLGNQLEHTEDHYELLRDGEVIAEEYHTRSPATRWYTQEQAVALYESAGFANLRLTSGFTHEAAAENDHMFCVFGTRQER